MLGTTVSMWLGITFVVVAVVATVLQAWLWSFPMLPDPGGPDPNGRSTAPRAWTTIHRVLGLVFVAIYLVMMAEMVPRLWEYQFELPARTVVHACLGMLIGILLVTKIAIIRWFQHFGKSLPSIGFAILACTLILATLSIPFALRAHDMGDALKPENLQRLAVDLKELDFEEPIDVSRLASKRGLERGLSVLTSKCSVCHDMRTVLRRPRTPAQWHDTVVRMTAKPTLRDPITPSDVPYVTAYLVAINRQIQRSIRGTKQRTAVRKAAAASLAGAAGPAPGGVAWDPARAEALFKSKCTECHEVSQVDEHGKDDRAGWNKVVKAMIADQEAQLTAEEARVVIEHLVRTRGK